MGTFEGLSYMSDDSSLDEYERDYWEAVALVVHPEPLKGVPGVPGTARAHPEGAAISASQRALRIFDGECGAMNYARREAVLEAFLEGARLLPPASYSRGYVQTFTQAIQLALSHLRIAGEAYRARYQEAEVMRERGRRELERYEREARRLEGYAEKHRATRLSDARFKA